MPDKAGESGGKAVVTRGDAKAALAGAAKRISAEYQAPYLAHAPLEPMNATAWVKDGRCEIWTSTQVPLMARAAPRPRRWGCRRMT